MNSQIYILLAFFITGIIIGLIFDIFRITRKAFKVPNILIYIEDILFWILTGIILLFTIFNFTTGEIRLYMIITVIFGSLTYFITISKYFILINIKVIQFLKSMVYFILLPFKKIWQFFSKIIDKIKIKFKKIDFFIKNGGK